VQLLKPLIEIIRLKFISTYSLGVEVLFRGRHHLSIPKTKGSRGGILSIGETLCTFSSTTASVCSLQGGGGVERRGVKKQKKIPTYPNSEVFCSSKISTLIKGLHKSAKPT